MNSIEIVEKFFGDQHLESSEFALPSRIPLRHMVVLAEALEAASRAVEERSVDRADDVPPFATDTVLLSGGRTASISTLIEVKHQLLLCDRSYVPDLLLDWGAELSLDNAIGFRDIEAAALRSRAELEAAISHIRPLAAAIRSGVLETVPTASGHRLRGRVVDRDVRQGTFEFLQHDPVTRRILREGLGITDFQLQDSFSNAELLETLDSELGVTPEVAARVMSLYGAQSMAELGDVIHFYLFCSELNSRPIATNRRVERHFELATAAVLAAQAETRSHNGPGSGRSAGPLVDVATAPPELANGLVIPIPELAGVSFDELMGLRQHDEVWEMVRDALTALSSDVRALDTAGMQYIDYLAEFRAIASRELEAPTMELQRALSRERWKSRIAMWSGSGLVKLTLRGAALTFPPAGFAAGPAGAGTGKLIQIKAAPKLGALTTANTLMLSLAEPRSATPNVWGGEG